MSCVVAESLHARAPLPRLCREEPTAEGLSCSPYVAWRLDTRTHVQAHAYYTRKHAHGQTRHWLSALSGTRSTILPCTFWRGETGRAAVVVSVAPVRASVLILASFAAIKRCSVRESSFRRFSCSLSFCASPLSSEAFLARSLASVVRRAGVSSLVPCACALATARCCASASVRGAFSCA